MKIYFLKQTHSVVLMSLMKQAARKQEISQDFKGEMLDKWIS
jgi:hypothetical protein